jgi:hypothetical protein
LRDLVLGQAKVNESLQKKLAANEMDSPSSAIKNHLRFNKMFETQLAQLVVVVPSAETGKLSGQPEASLESVNAVTTRWCKPSCGSPFTNYAEKLACSRRDCRGNLVAPRTEDPGYPVISFSVYDCHFEQALCDLRASVNIMPKVTFENLCYHALSPTCMCVQLANSMIRYPEGILKNLLVEVEDSFILSDFVVLDMEGDLGISLILRRPFLRDATARIDVGARKIHLRIMGKKMMFRFQTKKEQMYLIHQDHEGNRLWADPWLQSDDPSPMLPKSRKKMKVWRKKKMSPSSTSSPGTDEWTSS